MSRGGCPSLGPVATVGGSGKAVTLPSCRHAVLPWCTGPSRET